MRQKIVLEIVGEQRYFGRIEDVLSISRRKSSRDHLQKHSSETFEKLSLKLRGQDLPGVQAWGSYLLHLYRKNCRANTLKVNYSSVRLFLYFLKTSGVSQLEGVERSHLEAFIEYEQDRGMKPSSVKSRLACLRAFLRFLTDEGVVRQQVLARPIAVKVPDSLPRAIVPEDVKRLLSVIDNTRNRAMVLLLLRTGMRIGELLSVRLEDIDLGEQKVMIAETNKTVMGRVVYFSSDAKEALLAWIKEKDPREDVLFYGKKYETLTYSGARAMFTRYLRKAGLLHKDYTIHCLRHTYASELLNAGMRLECLQPLLGHSNIEITRRYARLTDKTREEEYFRAMDLIEKGEIHGTYRFDH